MGLVGDRDRERTAGALRRHYLEGRLSEDELDARMEATLRARTRFDLMLAARSLPRHPPMQELVASGAQTVSRVAKAVLLASLWLVASFVLLAAFAVSALFGELSTEATMAYPLGWLGITWLLWRHWRHGA